MRTTGHHPDGSSVQQHSCGSHYPYVIQARETPRGLQWEVFGPDIPREHAMPCSSVAAAQRTAEYLFDNFRRGA